MQSVQLINVRNLKVVGHSVWQATTFWTRLRGLLGRKKIAPGEGIWLIPCRQVHMFGMRYPLSVWFLDQTGMVCAIIDELEPGAVTPRYLNAESVLEFPAGWAKETDTHEGDRLMILAPPF